MELFKAHQQWATRPKDERFMSLGALYDATKAYASDAKEADVSWSDLRTVADGQDVRLTGKEGVSATLTNWSFKQLAARVAAPASYLISLPATLASQNLNYGLAQRESNPKQNAQLLMHTNGSLLVRAVTTEIYERIWNWEVAERLLAIEQMGWVPARPTGSGPETPPALYASDHDMFAFVMSSNHAIAEAGTDSPLYRGVIVENSEVGASSLKLTGFLYRMMCGNHIIWGAEDVMEFSIRHVGKARDKMSLWEGALTKYASTIGADDERQIASLKKTLIADTKEGVLDRLFGMRNLWLTKKQVEQSYDAVLPDEDGDPRTVWGFAQGVTRISQALPYADERNRLDRAAGRLLKMAF